MEFHDRFSKRIPISNLTPICPDGTEYIHGHRRTDGQDEAKRRFSRLSECSQKLLNLTFWDNSLSSEIKKRPTKTSPTDEATLNHILALRLSNFG
jgi:hypothetical protein